MDKKASLGQHKVFDKTLFILTIAFVVLGIVTVADASAPQAQAYFSDTFYFVRQQIVWGAIGLVLMILASFVHYAIWRKLALPLFGLSVILLILVLVPGLGISALGARRWLNLGFTGFQPSELVKLTIALYFAKLAESKKGLLSYLIPLGVVSALIMFQPDLGTNIVVLVVGLTQLFVSGIGLGAFIGTIIGGGILGTLLIVVSDYRRQRLMTFFESTTDPLGTSYHIRQILIAVGSGGLFGLGLGQSRQKYLFLPETATDSVFAVIAEEVGFFGAAALIVLFTFFVFRAMRIALRAPDDFSSSLAAGITAWIGGQMFLNVASMVALTPLTGIPLPFFSYGGSSLTMILVGVGILLNISRYAVKRKK